MMGQKEGHLESGVRRACPVGSAESSASQDRRDSSGVVRLIKSGSRKDGLTKLSVGVPGSP